MCNEMCHERPVEKRQPESTEIGSAVADLAKTGAAVLGVLYALGFVVVTIHLGRYHVTPFGLLRAQYLLAGLWLLFPLVGVVLPVLWAVGIYRVGVDGRSAPASRFRLIGTYIVRAVLAPGLAASYVWVMGYLVFRVAPELREEWGVLDTAFTLRYAGIVFVYAAALALISGTAWHHWSAVQPSDSVEAFHKLLMLLLLASFAVFTFVAYTLHFALNAYPRLPAVFGGGAPQPVILIGGDSQAMESIAQQLVAAASQPARYELVLETDKSYVLRQRNSESALIINKDAVRGLVFVRAQNKLQ